MNIATLNQSGASNPLFANFRAAFRQKMEDFKGLAQAVNSGDLTSAQTALDAVTKDIQSDRRIANSGKSDQINKDLAALGDAIKSGDTDATKQAFTTLAQDLKGVRHGGHHHRVDNDGDADDGGSAPVTPAGDEASAGTLNVTA